MLSIEEIQKERRFAERRINDAMREFIERTGLEERQVKASWDRCEISVYANPPPGSGTPVWTALISVAL